jgi:hypothetical protein
MPLPTDNRSLVDLMAELSRETGTLVRKELELATTELTAKARRIGTDIVLVAAGGAILYAGGLILLAAIVVILVRLGMDAWLSTLIVAVVTLIAGYVLMNRGLSRLRRTPIVPGHTVDTLKEAATWTTRQGA